MADPVIKRVGHANMNAQTAYMRARANTSGSGAGSRAHTAHLDAGANLSVCGAPEENHDRKYRSRQRFHFQILRSAKSVYVYAVNERPTGKFRAARNIGCNMTIWPRRADTRDVEEAGRMKLVPGLTFPEESRRVDGVEGVLPR
jgi:hypothetical protein